MPNARPAFMEKVTLTTSGSEAASDTDTWRFYPKHAADTWEFIVSKNNATIAWNGVSHEGAGELSQVADGVRTVGTTVKPDDEHLTSLDAESSVPSGGSATGHFVMDFGSFKAVQVSISGSGNSKETIITCKAYDKGTGTSGGSGFITCTAHRNDQPDP